MKRKDIIAQVAASNAPHAIAGLAVSIMRGRFFSLNGEPLTLTYSETRALFVKYGVDGPDFDNALFQWEVDVRPDGI